MDAGGAPAERAGGAAEPGGLRPPAVSMPRGGGAIRGIGEKLSINEATGTGSLTIPLPASPGRSGFGPSLALNYDSSAPHGPFGMGWSIGLPSITRKTDRGLPRYEDDRESDVFIMSGAEDLVPVLGADGKVEHRPRTVDSMDYTVVRYRPRVEGLFAQIERWTEVGSGKTHWRTISRDNVTTLYGTDDDSQIFDPADPIRRVFSWLISESFDAKGNAVVYVYARENSDGVSGMAAHERNRGETSRSANRYLKAIRYGNRVSRFAAPPADDEWLFELVFDYGEHDPEAPTARPTPGRTWLCRNDPFSSYRAGFEIRTYRLCQRVLMFHHFPRESDIGNDCLVRSMTLAYRNVRGVETDRQRGDPLGAFLESVTVTGHRRDSAGGYVSTSLPSVEFTYSTGRIDEHVRELDAGSLENLPQGLAGDYQWVDLDGESISGVLSEQADAWLYKHNLGDGHFGPVQVLPSQPSTSLADGRSQLLDLAADGSLDVASFGGPAPGFFERTDTDSGWSSHRPFATLPNLDWADPNLRFVDLNGDGRADILQTHEDALVWHPSHGEEGFGSAVRVSKPSDEEVGPRLVFADGTQSIYLADLSGDGLPDLVRVRNGEICYWPSCGYGRFGAKVVMDRSPRFDSPDCFDQRRIRLADLDGSGPTDIVYLGADGVDLYFNEMGNGWSEPVRAAAFPAVEDLSSVSVVDLLGRGTACMVWSSPLPDAVGRQVRYLDLMGEKPHLLTGARNNLGAETAVRYASSTSFYLADKAAGRPWITRLPFPVHVVERVETLDTITRNRFVTRYSYSHGRFDGREREFCGFGLVTQRDTEELAALSAGGELDAADNLDPASHVPPVVTKTWYHTGAQLEGGRISRQYEAEYYCEPGLSEQQARAMLLDDTVLPQTVRTGGGAPTPHSLSATEIQEACRALKGSMLRQEVYALDGSDEQDQPYSVTESNHTIELLQVQIGAHHAVLFTHPRETINFHYERKLREVAGTQVVDPRVQHWLTLEVGDFGDVLKSTAIAYGRRRADQALPQRDRAEQARMHITCTENRVTTAIDALDDYRTPLPCESRTFELTGATPPSGRARLGFDEVLEATRQATAIPYEAEPTEGQLEKRLIEHTRTIYRSDDLAGPLPLGDLEPLALPFESYQLAFTPGLIGQLYGNRVTDSILRDDAGYVHSEGDATWWIPSGRVFYGASPNDTAAQELAQARGHFFLPRRFRDPFHTSAQSTETLITYDEYDLLVRETCDALGNRITAGERDADAAQPLVRRGQDYRVLQPVLIMDPNRNRSAVAFDALGMVVGTALMGKPEEAPVPGDSLDSGFRADLTQAEIDQLVADPEGPIAATLLGDATTRFAYDLTAYQREPDPSNRPPAVTVKLAREAHASETSPVAARRIHVSFTYSDGFGREIQRKIPAEPGRVPGAGTGTVDPRWVGTGWTVFNNKGKPVRQYEPFFTETHRFEFDVRKGVSPILFYDPLQRVVAALHPDHTWEKTVVEPWLRKSWDSNDVVLVADPAQDADVGPFFSRLTPTGYLPTWHALRTDAAHAAEAAQRWPDSRARDAERRAAERAAVHAATPTVEHADSLGRAFLTVAHNKLKYSDAPADDPPLEEFHRTRMVLDVEGNLLALVDAQDRIVMRHGHDMRGNRAREESMESGDRWTLTDVAGKPLYAWDSRNHRLRHTYDALRRPEEVLLRDGGAAEIVVGRSVYGEGEPDPEASNLRGRVARLHDQAGVVTSETYDFKGNLLTTQRRLADSYKATLDWGGTVPLGPETYTSHTRYDALNRPTQIVAPHDDLPGTTVNVVQPVYNRARLLEQVHAWLNVDSEPSDLLDPDTAGLHVVTNVDYDAKGQRQRIDYGNGTRTTYSYDPLTFRLIHQLSRRDPAAEVQSLLYAYDPAGNVTSIRDDAQQTIFFRNTRVEPSGDYTYDAVYRLLEATGREHLGQVGGSPLVHSYNDLARLGVPHPGDGDAMGRYLERYRYDLAGNILRIEHRSSDPSVAGWTREFAYEEPSRLESSKHSNRLTSSVVGGLTETYSAGDGYDAHGNMLHMPQLNAMEWDFGDHLRMTQRQAVNAADAEGVQHQGERTWYVYDATGQRVRQVTESSTGQLLEERVYLAGFEVHRQHAGSHAGLVRESLHILDDKRRIALIETRNDIDDGSSKQLIRFQLENHLRSASLELSSDAEIISYEEYSPCGSTSYQAVAKHTEAPKRYRYTGKERDRATGLYYHGSRYYAAWLGRWIQADRAGVVDGTNLYRYAKNNPLRLTDSNGAQSDDEITFTSGGPMRRVGMALHVDEIIPVKGDKAGGVAGSPSDPFNKEFKDPRTNVQTKSNYVQTTPVTSKPNVSIAKDPQEAANRIVTGRLGEVDEVRAIANQATARTAPGERTNPLLREGMKKDQAVRGALSSVGVDPDTLTVQNPAGTPQFPTKGPVNLSKVDADIDPLTGRVVPGPNTSAAQARRAANQTGATSPVTPVATKPPVGGGGGLKSWGNAGLNAATQVVPGAAEGLVAAESAGILAARFGFSRLAGAAFAGAKAPGPAVVGGLVGAPAGHVAEGMALQAGLGKKSAIGVGVAGAVVTGAAVAAIAVLVVATAPVSLTVLAGAAIAGGLAAGFGYLSSRAMAQ